VQSSSSISLHVREIGLIQQDLAPRDVGRTWTAAHTRDRFDHLPGSPLQDVPVLVGLLRHTVAELGERTVSKQGFQIVVQSLQIARTGDALHLDNPVFHGTGARHQDRKDALVRERDEANLGEELFLRPWRVEDGGTSQVLREDVAGGERDVVVAGSQPLDALQERLLVGLGHVVGAHQGIHQGAEAAVGRNASCAGVRLHQVPAILQICQHVADRSGRQLQVVAFDELA